MKLDDYIRLNKLYDLYGGLLTKRQHDVMKLHVCDDFSLFEISEKMHITRQAVSDTINTARTKLEYYEQKLCFLEKTEKTRSTLDKLKENRTPEEIKLISDELSDIWKSDYEED